MKKSEVDFIKLSLISLKDLLNDKNYCKMHSTEITDEELFNHQINILLEYFNDLPARIDTDGYCSMKDAYDDYIMLLSYIITTDKLTKLTLTAILNAINHLNAVLWLDNQWEIQ